MFTCLFDGDIKAGIHARRDGYLYVWSIIEYAALFLSRVRERDGGLAGS